MTETMEIQLRDAETQTETPPECRDAETQTEQETETQTEPETETQTEPETETQTEPETQAEPRGAEPETGTLHERRDADTRRLVRLKESFLPKDDEIDAHVDHVYEVLDPQLPEGKPETEEERWLCRCTRFPDKKGYVPVKYLDTENIHSTMGFNLMQTINALEYVQAWEVDSILTLLKRAGKRLQDKFAAPDEPVKRESKKCRKCIRYGGVSPTNQEKATECFNETSSRKRKAINARKQCTEEGLSEDGATFEDPCPYKDRPDPPKRFNASEHIKRMTGRDPFFK
ncbi:MAG: hypothetical protein ACO330_01770 [Aquiluna sp.]